MTSALFGGSFDPVHSGHVEMVRHILGHGLADRIHVVPNARSPWREEPAAPAVDRLEMCRLAFAGETAVTVDDREVAGGTPARTVDTLEALAAEWPAASWRVVVGADHLATFRQWLRWERVLELAELLVLSRGLAGVDAAAIAAAGLPAGRVVVAPTFASPVSASAVRGILWSGGDARGLLPAAVADHIAARGLYRGA